MPLNLALGHNCRIKLNLLMGFNKEFILLFRLIGAFEMSAETYPQLIKY
jgi:hypothetical protein